MKRRSLMLGGIATSLIGNANAATRILGLVAGVPVIRNYVNQPTIIQQKCPEWCWAASASMIFAMHGYPVDQMAIVSRVFGGLSCMAGQGITMAKVLSDTWVDQNGVAFQSQLIAAYDFGNRVNAITNQVIVDELSADRPLLYGNQHHAMVVSQVDYINTPNGPNIQAVGVFDPWPWSQPFHNLTPAEMLGQHLGGEMGFLAAVHI